MIYTGDNKGVLWYRTLSDSTEYSIRDITVTCDGSGNGSPSIAFGNCAQLINCTSKIDNYGTGDSPGAAYGFFNCNKLTNCNCSIIAKDVYGFSSCDKLINCVISCEGSGHVAGFSGCEKLISCDGNSHGNNGSQSSAFAFRDCRQLTNCSGTGESPGTDSGIGYGFYECHYLNGCRQGRGISTTAFLGGTNTKVDTLTVVAS